MTRKLLPLLERHREPLEKCVYCPKLSRASCPVSNVHPRESLTPWGKMSASYFLGRGDLAMEEESARVTWGCSGCMACRERCDHKNDVATVLYDARAELFARGVAPAEATAVARRFDERARRTAERARDVGARLGDPDAKVAVLVGCGYHLHRPGPGERPLDEVALDVTASLLGGAGKRARVRPVEACCGLPLLHAGDREGFARAAKAFAREVEGASEIVGVDPGCARALGTYYPGVDVRVREPVLLVDLAARNVDRFEASKGPAPRYHDPCQLGRGLGRFDEPRGVLARIAGAPPREFQRHGRMAECSGAGGALPATMKEESHLIAKARIDEHRSEGGGVLVTACSASLARFRKSGEAAEDLLAWMARGLGLATSSSPADGSSRDG